MGFVRPLVLLCGKTIVLINMALFVCTVYAELGAR